MNLDLAPVADVNTKPQNPVIGIARSAPTPGSWRVTWPRSSAGCSARVSPPAPNTSPGTATPGGLPLGAAGRRRRSSAAALPPFRAAIRAGVRSIMTAHIVVPALDDAPGDRQQPDPRRAAAGGARLRRDGDDRRARDAGAQRERGVEGAPCAPSPREPTPVPRPRPLQGAQAVMNVRDALVDAVRSVAASRGAARRGGVAGPRGGRPGRPGRSRPRAGIETPVARRHAAALHCDGLVRADAAAARRRAAAGAGHGSRTAVASSQASGSPRSCPDAAVRLLDERRRSRPTWRSMATSWSSSHVTRIGTHGSAM